MTIKNILQAGASEDSEVIIKSPYLNDPTDIEVEHAVAKDGEVVLYPDHEFIVTPVEQYGVHSWYGRQAKSVLEELVKLSIDKDADLQKYKDVVSKLVQTYYNKVDTSIDIPERSVR